MEELKLITTPSCISMYVMLSAFSSVAAAATVECEQGVGGA